MQGPKTGFRASFILTALYAYRSNRDRTGKELIRVIEKHQVELLQNLPEGNLCHELVRRGHTRRGLVDIILPRFPIVGVLVRGKNSIHPLALKCVHVVLAGRAGV